MLRSADRQAAKDIYDSTLKEAQILGESVLLAEARLGEMLADQSSRGGTLVHGGRGSQKTLPPDIDKKASHYAQQLARHPEVIEEGVAQAKERGEIPMRSNVLKLIRTSEIAAA